MNSYSFYIQAFGCQMNASDSDWITRSLLAKGFTLSSFESADVYILTTCSVRNKAEQKVYSEIGRISSMLKRQKREGATICVGGCVAQQVGPSLMKRFPNVRLVFGTDGVSSMPSALEKVLEDSSLKISLVDFSTEFSEREHYLEGAEVPPVASVTIMQGCNNFCTYCIVPYVRGRQKSRDSDAIFKECLEFVKAGAKEILLLGQNVNSYGLDCNGISFSNLLKRVASIDGLERIRFMTSHPKDVSDELIDLFKNEQKICPRIHLPLQSGSDKILLAMNRKYKVKDYLSIIDKLNRARPDILYSTDIIVGFPDESDNDFKQTLQVMDIVGYVASFSFIYSDRPGAKAALFGNKIARDVSLERLSILQNWQDIKTDEILKGFIGKEIKVLLENKKLNSKNVESAKTYKWLGRTEHGINAEIEVPTDISYKGNLVEVKVKRTGRNSLKGSLLG